MVDFILKFLPMNVQRSQLLRNYHSCHKFCLSEQNKNLFHYENKKGIREYE